MERFTFGRFKTRNS